MGDGTGPCLTTYTARAFSGVCALKAVLAVFAVFCLLTGWSSLQAADEARAVGDPASVVFLSPGRSDEAFWIDTANFMDAAAQNLGMRLKVIHSERDASTLIEHARRIRNLPQPPDYLLFVNEMYTAPELLRIFDGSPVKLFALNSTLTAEQQAIIGGTRQHYVNWIGSLVPDDEEAGYLMARQLISLLGGQSTSMVAFSGVRSTPSAALREQGLRRALADNPQITLRQLVYGEWQRARAYEQARTLMQRHKDIRVVWSANDEMAFGAMQAARELGRAPGKKVYFAAMNSSQAVLQARVAGEVSVLFSGHFTLGGWAMVMLHDYHAGQDFAQRGGKDRMLSVFRSLDAQQAARLAQRLRMPGYGLDFKRFSAVYHPDLQQYDFSVAPLLE